ncbi:MAG TPA: hypothetical protein VK548_20110 [Candidatus Acidoferrum sp.]|nr:hypothetical protein [Candidatus Acidoferrum sp.]
METFILKLIVTPVLIGVASLAGRRWGQAVSGWLVGLPLTSGPIAWFVALDHGVGFAAATAVGALAAAIAEAAFCLAYAYTARRAPWPLCLVTACVAFTAMAVGLRLLTLPVIPVAAIVFATLAIALRAMPAGSESRATPPPRWDLPLRMVTATLVVVAITEAAPALGPRLSGVLGAFPVYAAILTVFGHRSGAASATQVLRGLLLGLFGFAGFFLVLALLIERAGLALAFAGAIATTLAIQAMSLIAVLRTPKALGAIGP